MAFLYAIIYRVLQPQFLEYFFFFGGGGLEGPADSSSIFVHVHAYSRVVGSRTPDPRRCYHSPRVRMRSIFVGGYSGIAGDLVAYVTFCGGSGDDLKKRDTSAYSRRVDR